MENKGELPELPELPEYKGSVQDLIIKVDYLVSELSNLYPSDWKKIKSSEDENADRDMFQIPLIMYNQSKAIRLWEYKCEPGLVSVLENKIISELYKANSQALCIQERTLGLYCNKAGNDFSEWTENIKFYDKEFDLKSLEANDIKKDRELSSLLSTNAILPMYRDTFGFPWILLNTSINDVFTWRKDIRDKKEIRRNEIRKLAFGYKPIADIKTFHSFNYSGFFKASTLEVLQQIPSELLNITRGFELIKRPMNAEDMNQTMLTCRSISNCYHTSTMRLYTKL